MRNAVYVLLTESPCSSWTNSTTSRFSAGFRAFFRSHTSRPDFPGLSPHTFVWDGHFHAQGRAYAWCPKLPCRRTCLPCIERGTADIVLTTYVLGSPVRFDRLQDCDDLVFRKPWLLHGSLLGMVYQKSPVLVCTILREGYTFSVQPISRKDINFRLRASPLMLCTWTCHYHKQVQNRSSAPIGSCSSHWCDPWTPSPSAYYGVTAQSSALPNSPLCNHCPSCPRCNFRIKI